MSNDCTPQWGCLACTLVDLLSNEVSSLLDGGNLLSTFLVELEVEFLLKSHHNFDGIEGIGSKINKLGLGSHLQGKGTHATSDNLFTREETSHSSPPD